MGETRILGAAAVVRDDLLTGEEYLESLRDGRRVHLYGEAVKDVVDHPAFRNSARSVVRLYDALHAPETRDVLTGVDAFGNRTHKFFKPSYSAAELLEAREAIAAWAMPAAMALDPQEGPGGSVVPKLEYANTLRLFATLATPKVKEVFENILGGSPLVTPSSYRDLKDPDLGPLIEKYYRGSESSAEERIKLFKLIWDAIGTEFGGRHELYDRNYSGNHEQIRLDMVKFAGARGIMQECTDLVDECLGDYDLDGWTSPAWTFEEDANG